MNILYVKGFNKTHKKNEVNLNENRINRSINSKGIEWVTSLHQKFLHLNSKSKEWIQKLVKHENMVHLKTTNDDEHKVSIMVSALGDSNSRNHIHDIYSVNKGDRTSPKLIFRKSKQVVVTAFQKKMTRRTRNIDELKYGSINGQKMVCRLSKPSNNRLVLPSISSSGRSEITNRNWSVHE